MAGQLTAVHADSVSSSTFVVGSTSTLSAISEVFNTQSRWAPKVESCNEGLDNEMNLRLMPCMYTHQSVQAQADKPLSFKVQ